jgi:hypothetical protein
MARITTRTTTHETDSGCRRPADHGTLNPYSVARWSQGGSVELASFENVSDRVGYSVRAHQWDVAVAGLGDGAVFTFGRCRYDSCVPEQAFGLTATDLPYLGRSATGLSGAWRPGEALLNRRRT